MERSVSSYIPAKRNLPWIVLGVVSFVVLVILVIIIYSRKECSSNDHCPHDRVCASHKCVDGCVGLCGHNTTCHVINHVAMCTCLPGHTGHPFTGCEPTPSPPECSSNDHCPHDRVCGSHKCVDGCVGLCGHNTTCHVINHVAMCACLPGHTGHPITGCMPPPPPPAATPGKPVEQIYSFPAPDCLMNHHCEGLQVCVAGKCILDDPSCSQDHECPGFQVCISNTCTHSSFMTCNSDDDCSDYQKCSSGRCQDPCVGICNSNATCVVHAHIPTCSCKEGYTGNPYSRCTQGTSETPSRKKRFYLNSERSVDWHQALMNCRLNGSQLVSVDSEEELGEINRLIMESGVRYGRYWTSGSDADQEGIFLWESSGKPISMTTGLWMKGEPNANGYTGEDCVELWERYPDYPTPGYFLNDVPCSMEFNYICEYFEEA